MSDFARMIGARGDDQTKEWPGAIMPALPKLAPEATSGLRSSDHDLVAVALQLIGGRDADHAAAEHHYAHER